MLIATRRTRTHPYFIAYLALLLLLNSLKNIHIQACDFVAAQGMMRRALQEDNSNDTFAPTITTDLPTTSSLSSPPSGLPTTPATAPPTQSSSNPATCLIQNNSTVKGLEVDLKMFAYQARGHLKVTNNCQFELRRFEMVLPEEGVQLTWYTSQSLEIEDVNAKRFLTEFTLKEDFNATTDFVGEGSFEFMIDSEVSGYDLESVGAFLLVATTPESETLVASALIQKLVPGPAADLLAAQPTMMENCWTVGEDVRLRWTIDATANTIDWGLEYVAWIPTNTWMAIGPAFPGLENRLMGGSDVAIGGFRQGDEEDVPFVDDFYIGGYEVCTKLTDGSYDGVCRDSTYTGDEQDNDAELLYSQSMDGVSFLRIRRPLQDTTQDYDHDLTPGVPQNLLWARGPLSPNPGIDDIQFHGYRYGELKGIDLNEPVWKCPPLDGIDLDGEGGEGALGDDAQGAFDLSTDDFARKFDQRVLLDGNHVEVFWTLLPESNQIYIGARTSARSSSQWMSIAIGESMTDSWAWVASFANDEPQLLTYRMSGLDASTVRMTSEIDKAAMMVVDTTSVRREDGRLSFETIAEWPLRGMSADSTAAPIIYAIGTSWRSSSASPRQQDEHSIRSAAPTTIDFATGSSEVGEAPQNTMLLLHGVFMWLAWLVLAPLTSITSRYFRDDPCVPAGSTPSWIQLHKYGAISVIALSLLGFILALVAAQDTGLGHFVSSHARIGMALVVMIFLQNGFGMVRPPADNPPVPVSLSLEAFTRRRVWSWSHRTFAISMLSLGIAAVITGSQRLESFDTRTRHGIMLSIVWIVMVALLIMLYELRKQQLAKDKAEKEAQTKAAAAQAESNSEDEAPQPTAANPEAPKPSSWEGSYTWIYVLPAAIGLGALVTLAAITFNPVMSEPAEPMTAAMTTDQVVADTTGAGAVESEEVSAPTDCSAYPPSHIGDGWCDDFEPFNTAACGYDAGDCCDKTAPIFNCKDPSSPNFGTSSPRGWGGVIPRNPRYTVSREESLESFVTTYNNYYEFGTSKSISEEANKHADFLEADGWFIDISGLVENPMTLNVAALIDQMQLEERMYRHRCVEAWSITSPWIGFPLSKLLDMVRPLPEAGIVRFVSWQDSKHSSTQLTTRYPWPYTEALTLAEARNELAMLTVGNFQKPLTPSQGAPIRLTVPWKFGYKSIKSIEQITFMRDDGPISDSRRTFWSETIRSEYGFWSNINPEVPHRRWSQATERHYISGFPGTRLDTVRMNGYQDLVDYMYEDVIDDPEIYF